MSVFYFKDKDDMEVKPKIHQREEKPVTSFFHMEKNVVNKMLLATEKEHDTKKERVRQESETKFPSARCGYIGTHLL